MHLQSGNFDTDCFGLSGDKFTRRLARGHVPKQDERVVSDCHEPSARVPYWSGKSGSLIFLHENTAICGERIRRIKAFPVCYGFRGGSCETFVSPTVVKRN